MFDIFLKVILRMINDSSSCLEKIYSLWYLSLEVVFSLVSNGYWLAILEFSFSYTLYYLKSLHVLLDAELDLWVELRRKWERFRLLLGGGNITALIQRRRLDDMLEAHLCQIMHIKRKHCAIQVF